MATFVALVHVRCATREQAEHVLNELWCSGNHEQDYGFLYEVEWKRTNPLVHAIRPEETRL